MRNIIITLFIMLLLISVASAEIILTEQLNQVYNLGDSITIPVTIKSASQTSGIFEMNLICEGQEINFYKNGVGLEAGGEQKMESSLILTKNMINDLKGNCKIKSSFGEDYVLTEEFRISDSVIININNQEIEFNPGETILLKGTIKKENQEDLEGFIEIDLTYEGDSQINKISSVTDGFFSLNISLPEKAKAGVYLINYNAYEKDQNNDILNQGTTSQNILVQQIPTELEIFFETKEVEPGTNLRVKAILHDQTGEKIQDKASITIKNSENKIIEQANKETDEYLEYYIEYNYPPSNLSVSAVSRNLSKDKPIQIIAKEKVKTEIINQTAIITNTGNVPYAKAVTIKIGDNTLEVFPELEVDESKRYQLTAPDGEYLVEIVDEQGNPSVERVMLTGKSIEVKEVKTGITRAITHPFVWVFILIILGFVIYILLKKGYKRSFFGRIPKIKYKLKRKNKSHQNTLFENTAEITLSLKGNKQASNIICLKIKNLKEVMSNKKNLEKLFQEISYTADKEKAKIYENQHYVFFIIAPATTKTFKNEIKAIQLAQKIKQILKQNNKTSKTKIDFGIGINKGDIIAKLDHDKLKFMSLGTLMSIAKKISNHSEKDISISKTVHTKVLSEIKTQKHKKDKLEYYQIKEIKHKKLPTQFLKDFMKRMDDKK